MYIYVKVLSSLPLIRVFQTLLTKVGFKLQTALGDSNEFSPLDMVCLLEFCYNERYSAICKYSCRCFARLVFIGVFNGGHVYSRFVHK